MVTDREQTPAFDLNAGIAKWQTFPASTISHHGSACCEVAREWMFGMDFSQLNGANPLTGPRWLRQKFKWGPSKWPIHWCELIREKTLDCGALAALSHQLFLNRGVRTFPAQLILEFNDASARHWQETWNRESTCTHWIGDGLIYHEGCAVAVNDHEIKVWDSTATWWVNPKQFGGYAGLLALRVLDSSAASATNFIWGANSVPANTWHKMERATNDFAQPQLARKTTAKRRSRGGKKKAIAPAALV